MDYDALRKNMVQEQLIAHGDITDRHVLAAFLKVPRHKFVPLTEQNSAYGDFPLPIGHSQTISQPYMVALMTQCLKLQGGEKVLEIGTGSGYQTAILAELAKSIYTIERFQDLSDMAKQALAEIGYTNIYFKVGDGSIGWDEYAPFEAVIVTAAAPKAPDSLLAQLADRGRLVIPIGSGLSQVLTIYTKNKKRINITEVCSCVFVPLVGKEGWSK